MSIIQTLPNGWVVSHEKFIEKIYKNVYVKEKIKHFQLKHSLFNINTQFLRKNQTSNNSNITNLNNLKKKRRKISTETNFEKLRQEIKYVKNCYEDFCTNFMPTNNFNILLDNTEARNEAEKFYNESNKYSIAVLNGTNADPSTLQVINNVNYLFPKNCKFFCNNVMQMNDTFSNNEFDVILLDPPWWNKYIRRKNAKSEQGYQMMNNVDLSSLPIKRILSIDGLVIVWCTNAPQNLKDLEEKIFPNWGVRFITKWYWLKVTNKGVPVCDFSDPPCKQPFEQIIFGTKITNAKNIIPHEKVIVSVPSAIHSHKPPLSELLSPYIKNNSKCLEIFARYLLPGWTSYGLEVLKLQHEYLYEIQ